MPCFKRSCVEIENFNLQNSKALKQFVKGSLPLSGFLYPRVKGGFVFKVSTEEREVRATPF